jgi:hypothetical protein
MSKLDPSGLGRPLSVGEFGARIMGGVVGAATLVSSLDMALGPLAGG